MASEFQLIGYLRLLAEHGVEYLIVGGVGARIQGAATTTQDIDIMPDPAPENLQRLARALSHVGFRTNHGVIDVIMELPGVGTFDVVRPNARRYGWDNLAILVANIDDIIKSKETADRAKDWRAMDALYDARSRLRDRPDDYELSDSALDVQHAEESGTEIE